MNIRSQVEVKVKVKKPVTVIRQTVMGDDAGIEA
jgi:hypothetical protein